MKRSRLGLLLVLGMLAALLPVGAVAPAIAADDHLMLTEIVVTPTGGEFIEIHNPTGSAVDLSDYYLTDATFASGSVYYYNIVTGADAGGGGFSDFHSRFPDSASIAPDEYQTVAIAGSADFFSTYGVSPTYELYEDDLSADAVPDMREALPGSINDQGGLTNGGEFVVLYMWNGVSDLVTDVDYAVWGDKDEAVDKTGVAVDGPDGDAVTTSYSADTAIASQDVVDSGAHASGDSFQRLDMTEGTETGLGGNGVGGDDETSENTGVTWGTAVATPGAAAPPPPPPPTGVAINEIHADPASGAAGDANGDGARDSTDDEFVEIVNASGSPLVIDGWTLSDGVGVRHTFPSGTTIPDGCSIVVFGGNTPTGPFGYSAVQTASSGSLGLNNGGDSVTLSDGTSDVTSATYGGEGGDNQSLTLDPDISGASFVKHSVATGSGGALFSPGTKIDGSSFDGCSAPPPEVVINEIMQNPSSVWDSNGEWVELFNPTASDIDIDGWTIKDDDSDSHVITNGSPLLVPAGGYLVLGRNADSGANGGVTVGYQYADFSLANSTDEVVLLDGSLAEVDRVNYDNGSTFPDPDGASMQLSEPSLDNNVGANWCQATVPFGDGDSGTPGDANFCAYKIHDVQGSGFSSPLVSTDVVIEGVVVGDFQGNALTTDGQDVGDQLDGFYVQEEAADWDGDSGTSEGIFVFAPDAVDVMVGDVVSVIGTVQEFFGRTQIGRVRSVGIGAIGQPTVATSVSLPVTSSSDWEQYEGMLLTFPQALHISEFYGFGRYGEIVLTTERQYQGTHVTSPGAGANAIADANALARVIVDDGRTSQNPDPAVHPNGEEFDLTNYFRGGDTVAGMTAVMDYNFGAYKLQPVYKFAAGVAYTNENVRPTQPDDIDGDIRVASFNVLNFFTHTDDGDDSRCGPVTPHQCRGADNSVEYERQLDKLVAGIRALDADIVGIQEIENDIRTDDDERAHDAVLTLVEELNDKDGAGTWAWAGDAGYYNGYPVRNEVIYRTDAVVLDGSPMALQHEAFDLVRPSGDGLPVGRPPLAATFRPNTDKGSNQKFTVVVNHFKSKGSPCDDIGDPDTGDGQANCNLTRVAQSEALLGFVSDLQDEVSGVLVVGDLNSYAMEDPITTLEDGGLTELLKKFIGPDAYSYVFDGQLGYLDTALATRSMLNWVKGVTVFHINADEANIFDYDTSFKKSAQDALYDPLPYRVSDHDPVIVGISFGGKKK